MPFRRAVLAGLIASAACFMSTNSATAQTPSVLQQIVSRGTLRIAVLPSLPAV